MTLEFIVVLIIGLIFSLLSVLHVILGALMTKTGQVYLATGTYYMDYFYYLQFIAQGLRGAWFARLYSTTDDPSIYPHLQPYILIGKIGSLLNLDPNILYWLTVFVLVFITILLMYFVINKLLNSEQFIIKISALLIGLLTIPYADRFIWYAPNSVFDRLTPIPHHLLNMIVVLIISIILGALFEDLINISFKRIIFLTIILSLLLVAVFSFYPFVIFLVCGGIGLIILYFFLDATFKKKPDILKKMFVFLTIFITVVIPCILMIRYYYNKTALFTNAKTYETAYHQSAPLSLVLTNIGIIIIFIPLAIKKFLKKINTTKLFFVGFVLTSYGLYMTRLDLILGTHNGRFLSPLSFVLFGVMAALGIKTISNFFGKLKNLVFILLTIILLSYFIPTTIRLHQQRMNDRNIFSPITYLPKTIVDGFVFLNSDPDARAVLTTPCQFLGIIVPIYVNKHVYIGRDPATPNYTEKAAIADRFYLGRMSIGEAEEFFNKNNIGFVILTSIEGYLEKDLKIYPFLKEFYRNSDIVIFKNTL